MTQTFTLNIQQEDNTFQQFEVSKEFMELLFASARQICDKITKDTTSKEVIEMIKEVTSDHNHQNIMFDMVEKIMLNRINKAIMQQVIGMIDDMLGI